MKKTIIILCLAAVSGCSPGDSKKSMGDSSSVTNAGGPPIRDTTTINKDRRDSANIPAGDTMNKGNADPTGHMSPKPVKKQ